MSKKDLIKRMVEAKTHPPTRKPRKQAGLAAVKGNSKPQWTPTASDRTKALQIARNSSTVSTVAEALGVDVRTLRTYCDRDPFFGEALQSRIDYAIGEAEQELYRRAMAGRDDKFYDSQGNPIQVFDSKGVPITPLSVASNDLLKFFLRSRKAQVYNPSPVKIELNSTTNNLNLTVEKLKALTDEQLFELASLPDDKLNEIFNDR